MDMPVAVKCDQKSLRFIPLNSVAPILVFISLGIMVVGE
jgi:hypothetical protein